MLDFVNSLLKKFFGSKAERDLKELTPFVGLINSEYEKLLGLSNDALRAKTAEFKQQIQDHIQEIENELAALHSSSEENPDMDLQEKEKIFTRVDELKKERNQKIEEVLLEILPAAFAVIKDTARRLKENSELEVTATEHDKNLAVKKSNVIIRGDKAYYQNKWMAAGN